MADTQQPVEHSKTPIDRQVTSKTPATQPPIDQQVTLKTPATRQKNSKRVAAGKATAERANIAREAQKKALIEAQSLIAKYKAKPADPVADTPPAPVADTPSAAPETTKNVLTTTQYLSIISIVVSLVGVYYKREEIKKVLSKKAAPPSPVLPRAPPPSPATPPLPRAIRKMD